MNTSMASMGIEYAHRFYKYQGEAQYLHGHTGTLTIAVEDSINPGVNMVFPCNEIKKTAWHILQNFDHALVLREDDPLLPAILEVYEKQGIRNGAPTNQMCGPSFDTELAEKYGQDDRIQIWDVWNEPGNSKRGEMSCQLMEKCFEIIQEGSGQDFDPVLVEVFLDIRDKVEEIHKEFNQ